MTVLLAVHRLQPAALTEAREACKELGLDVADWVHGIPRVTPRVMICGLDHGERRIPEDVLALLEATPTLALVLCAKEPLVKPRVVLYDGRVTVLSPPVDRTEVMSVLRAAILPPPPPQIVEGYGERRFEALRRTHWVAWSRGRTAPAISLHEQRGVTVVMGDGTYDRPAIADAMTSTQTDADREASLGVLAGTSAVAHLTQDANEWVVYWPQAQCPLWIYSPNRLPSRWDAARSLASTGGKRLLRLSAFPGDQLVAAWLPSDANAITIDEALVERGPETLVGLDAIASREDRLTGLVMEVR